MHFLRFFFQVPGHPFLLLLYFQRLYFLLLPHALHLFLDWTFLLLLLRGGVLEGGDCGRIGEEFGQFHLKVEVLVAPDGLIVLDAEGVEFDEFSDGFVGGFVGEFELNFTI